MAQDPAFLFYSSDFLTGTQFFTNEQKGKYITLLCLQHQQGHLREKHILMICGTRDNDIMEKFTKDDEGLYYNSRLEKETEKRKNYSKSRRENRLSGIEKSKNKTPKDNPVKASKRKQSYVPHMENENENINEVKIENKKGVQGEKTLWEEMIKSWFEFYKTKKSTEPTFEGKDAIALKAILAKLEKRSIEKKYEWNIENARNALHHFLMFAYADQWLSENFMLNVINQKFDKIITNGNKGTHGNDNKYSALERQLEDTISGNKRE